MKYVFKYQFDNVSEKGFIISHQINLSNSERKELQQVGNFVETFGTSVPVFHNEIASEVFCKYKLIIGHAEKPIKIEDCGWTINLFGQQKLLKDIKDGGSKFLSIAYHDMVEWKSKIYPTLHQIVISDIEDLDNSLYLDHLFQTSSK